MGLSMIDYGVWWQLMALSLGIGVYIKVNYKPSGHIILNPVDDFYLAGRQLGILPVALSVIASFITAITLMDGLGEYFEYGASFFMVVIAFSWIIALCVFLFAPLYEKLPIITVYEYIGWRFDNRVRLVGVAMYIVRMILYLSNSLIIPVLSLEEILDSNHWLLMVVTVSLAVVFTSLAGMRAVVWSNVFQLLLLLILPFTVFSTVISSNDTLTDIFRASYYTNRLHIVLGFDFDERYSVLSAVTSLGLMYLGMYGTHQVVIQQFLSLKDKKNIKITYIISAVGYCFVLILVALICIIIAFHYMACDPKKLGQIPYYNWLLSKYVSKAFLEHTGLAGAVIAAIFGTGLSTISSAVLTMATVTLNDIILIYRKDLSSQRQLVLLQLFILLYGVLVIGSAILTAFINFLVVSHMVNVEAMFTSHITLFFMAWCLPCVNSYGALSGFLVSDVSIHLFHYLGFQKKFTYKARPSTVSDCKITDEWIANQTDLPALFSGQYIFQRSICCWEPAISVIVGISVGCIVSVYTNKRVDIKDRKVDSRLISPLVHKWFKSYLKFSKDSYLRPEESKTKPDTTKSKRKKSYKPKNKEEIIN